MSRLLVFGIFIGAVAVMMYWWMTSGPIFDPASIQGKRVLVTGASSGIGEELAYNYARLGASVFITARREELLSKVITKCKEIGSSDAVFGYIAADMSKLEQTETVIKEAVSLLGGLDQLILNHAFMKGLHFWEGSSQNLTDIGTFLQVNTLSFIHLASHALPHLVVSRGNIGVVSSISGKNPTAMLTGYSTSKFALDGFFSSLRTELEIRKKGVSVTLCIIGIIDTESGIKQIDEMIDTLGLNRQSVLKWVKYGETSETALAILSSTTLGEHELYFPPSQFIKLRVILSQLFPELTKMDLTKLK